MIGNKSFCERLPQMILKAHCSRPARTGQRQAFDYLRELLAIAISTLTVANQPFVLSISENASFWSHASKLRRKLLR